MEYIVEAKHTNKAVKKSFHNVGEVIDLTPDEAYHPLKNGLIIPAEDGTDEPVVVKAEILGSKVEILKGIGPVTTDKLGNIGIKTVEGLAVADVETVAGAGFDKSVAEEYIEKAQLYMAERSNNDVGGGE